MCRHKRIFKHLVLNSVIFRNMLLAWLTTDNTLYYYPSTFDIQHLLTEINECVGISFYMFWIYVVNPLHIPDPSRPPHAQSSSSHTLNKLTLPDPCWDSPHHRQEDSERSKSL